MPRIIDDVRSLMKLNENELEEALSDNKYNKQNLKELLKRSLKVANEYRQAFEYSLDELEEKEDEVLRE